MLLEEVMRKNSNRTLAPVANSRTSARATLVFNRPVLKTKAIKIPNGTKKAKSYKILYPTKLSDDSGTQKLKNRAPALSGF